MSKEIFQETPHGKETLKVSAVGITMAALAFALEGTKSIDPNLANAGEVTGLFIAVLGGVGHYADKLIHEIDLSLASGAEKSSPTG